MYQSVELVFGGEDTQLIAAEECEPDEAELREGHVELGDAAETSLEATPRGDAVLLAYVLQGVEEPAKCVCKFR